MKTIKRMFNKLLLILLIVPSIGYAQKSITGNFAVENGYKFGILYRIAPDNVFYVADSNVDKEGSFTLELKDEIAPGMYRLVYNLPQDQHFFDFLYDGKEAVDFNFSEEKKISFNTSEANKYWNEYRSKMNAFETELSGFLEENNPEKKSIEKILNKRATWYHEILERSESTLAATFIKATQPYLDATFSNKREFLDNVRNDYLSNFDFTNPLLQNSGLPLEQSLKYIFNFVDIEDAQTSHFKNMDALAGDIQTATKKYQKHLLTSIWDFMVFNEQVIEANYLATKHLIPIANAENDTALVNELQLYKNLSIGAKAPNFSWDEDIDGKTVFKSLHTIDDAETYIIVFWSALCSHCLKEVPELHNELASQPDGKFRVIAVGIEDEPYDWKNTIFNMPNFTHVLGLGKWENEIGNKYDISSTPTYFVLDKDKKIVAKPENYEELMEVIQEIEQ